jgi:hypothetical protein
MPKSRCPHQALELTRTRREEVTHYTHKMVGSTRYYKCNQCGTSLYDRTEEMDRPVPLEPTDA